MFCYKWKVVFVLALLVLIYFLFYFKRTMKRYRILYLFIYLFIYFFVCFVSLIIFLPLLNNDSVDSKKVSIYSGKFYYLIFKYIHIIRFFIFVS